MHIRGARLATVFAVVKPSHIDGVDTLSFQFYDRDGAAAFKVFVTFGGKKAAPGTTSPVRRAARAFP